MKTTNISKTLIKLFLTITLVAGSINTFASGTMKQGQDNNITSAYIACDKCEETEKTDADKKSETEDKKNTVSTLKMIDIAENDTDQDSEKNSEKNSSDQKNQTH
ncbi:MAG: hypothetical protein QS748_04330 [Candidatus Endonucleobacter bathymodioli]|uniref:Uncharacterized protein n=1 Tax=Candidatus Endonucleibacter bathymodioli TaxID=539814 RepID=A0AA90NXE9_9GAMM|nr:hypothetical protein [Candidatus Endonucleobacter bathymodioli]